VPEETIKMHEEDKALNKKSPPNGLGLESK